ncbi:hypothetical protein ACVWXQ_007274 [Bradyrhizobium sp. S3.14.4]
MLQHFRAPHGASRQKTFSREARDAFAVCAAEHRRYGPRISGAERQRRVKDKLALQPTPPTIRSPTALRALAVRRPKVAIIGGGFAGLMAASELVAHCEVTLFEARDRFGGRVLSKKKPSGIVEAGGELIGYNHPLWLKYAKRFELGLSVITSDTNFDALELDMPVFLDGHKLSDGQMKRVYHEMDDAFGKLSRWAGRVKPDKPWRAKGARKLDARTIAEWIASLDCSKLTKHAMEEQFSNDAGQPTTKQSLLANLAVVAGGRMKDQIDAFFTQTETLRCSEGNQELAIRLAQDIEDKGASTHLSTPVRAIRIDSEGVTLEFSPCGNGTARASFAADYAVLAIPPSLWPDSPNAKITITPHLPHDLLRHDGDGGEISQPAQEALLDRRGPRPDGHLEPVRCHLGRDGQPDRPAGSSGRAQPVRRRRRRCGSSQALPAR